MLKSLRIVDAFFHFTSCTNFKDHNVDCGFYYHYPNSKHPSKSNVKPECIKGGNQGSGSDKEERENICRRSQLLPVLCLVLVLEERQA
ncbi:hypothetical protein J6590_036724 [Homalodisca vitripennis]|nr:hypothetical protein J6590_036724 [Homalodisca vitripennis]